MDEDYFTVIIGAGINGDGKKFLISPTGQYVNVNDEVEAEDGIAYDVMFSKAYVRTDDSLFIALFNALGMPKRIVLHKTVQKVKWGDEDEGIAVSPPDNSTGRLGSKTETGIYR